MGLLKEFKDFALKGNVIDMAVGVIIGSAFTAVVSGVVENILTPIVTVATGGMSISDWAEAFPTYAGNLVGEIVSFLLTALCLFLIVKGIKAAETKAAAIAAAARGEAPAEPPAPTTKVCPFCHSEIHIDATRCPHCTSELSE